MPPCPPPPRLDPAMVCTTWNRRVALACTLAGGCYGGIEEHRVLGLEGVERAFPGQEPDDVVTGWFLVDDEYQQLEYEVYDGLAILQGDILLGPVSEFTAEELGERDPDRSAVRPDKKWKNGVVPYVFDPALAEVTKERVNKAIAHWEKTTKIDFVKRTNQDDYVVFQGGPGCYTYVGRQGIGAQFVTLSKKHCDLKAAIHEIGHVVGLYHEQSRSDRDEHVAVLWQNIAAEDEVQFATFKEMNKAFGGFKGANVGAYDFDSIMHYPWWAFSVNGEPTILRRNKPEVPIAADRIYLSAGDQKGVAFLYGSPTQNSPGTDDEPTQDEPLPDDDAIASVNACWIGELFRDVLGREPDAAGQADWVAAMANGVPPGEVAGGFVRSPEALDGFLRGLYTDVLRRAPDDAGLADWKAAMAGGMTKQAARAEFLAGGEYWANIAGSDRRRMIELMYQDVLGRTAAATEVDGWLAIVGSLDTVDGRRALALDFMNSDEGRARTVDNGYSRWLHRAADDGGKAGYVEAMRNGLAEEVLAVEMLISSEYLLRCPG